jgi:hypothetical protein
MQQMVQGGQGLIMEQFQQTAQRQYAGLTGEQFASANTVEKAKATSAQITVAELIMFINTQMFSHARVWYLPPLSRNKVHIN